MKLEKLQQCWDSPSKPKPIVIIGAGGIVNDAHLPAYKKAGLLVVGLYDIKPERSALLAEKWAVETVYSSLEQAAAIKNCIYDIALPPSAIDQTLLALPDNAAVLIQKPMGENFQQAKKILAICRSKNLTAAINFQLRFSPQMLALADAIRRGLIGELLEIEVNVNIDTPWHLFPFLKTMERVEIAVHSIHYLDLIRGLIGSPNGVFVRTLNDPRVPQLTQTRTTALLDYGDTLRCLLSINHNHKYGGKFQTGRFRFEGTKGAIVAKVGAILNYPDGEADELWIATHDQPWAAMELTGTWFPDAFIGTMFNLQRFVSGEDDKLINSVEDSIATMSLVEACFQANKTAGTPLPM